MNSILLVEDDKTIAMGVEYSLKQEGFETHVCYDVSSAKLEISKQNYALIILDRKSMGTVTFLH